MCCLLCLILELICIVRLRVEFCIYIIVIVCTYCLFKLLQVIATWVYIRNNKKEFCIRRVLGRVYADVCSISRSFAVVGMMLLVEILFIPVEVDLEMPDALLVIEEDAEKWQELEYTVLSKISSFAAMSKTDKLKLVQDIVDYEMDYLGVNYDIKLNTMVHKDEGWCGEYRHSSKEICVRESLIEGDDIEKLLSVILHECYHAYQLYCIDINEEAKDVDYSLRMNKQILVWEYENINYKTVSNNGYEAYSNQSIERDADGYVKYELDKYRTFFED